MINVKVGPRNVVYVKGDVDRQGVYCSFFGDNTEDFPLGNRFVELPRNASKQTVTNAMISAAKDYFSH